jgi:acyl-coenzyme A thioesterase PaaI-like protein
VRPAALALAENLAGAASSMTLFLAREVLDTIAPEVDPEFYRRAAGIGPVMKATVDLLHAGRTTMVWQTTIRNSSDGKRVAIVTQTQIRLPAK